MGERRLPRQAIIMVAEEREDRHPRVPEGQRQGIERGPRRRGGAPQDQVADNRQKVGALGHDLVDQLAPGVGIRRAPDLEAGGGLEVPHNGEPPAVDVERPTGKWPWGARPDPLKRCCTRRSTAPGCRTR